MGMRKMSKRTLVLLVAVVAAVVAAVGGYAYFTTTGSGSGSATVGTSTAWTVGENAPASTGGSLYPDPIIGTGNIRTTAYRVTNPGSGNQYLTKVDVKVANPDGSAWSSGSCDKDDFSVGGAALGATFTDTDSAGTFTAGQVKNDTVTVQMIDDGTNQDDCKSVSVPLYFSAS